LWVPDDPAYGAIELALAIKTFVNEITFDTVQYEPTGMVSGGGGRGIGGGLGGLGEGGGLGHGGGGPGGGGAKDVFAHVTLKSAIPEVRVAAFAVS